MWVFCTSTGFDWPSFTRTAKRIITLRTKSAGHIICLTCVMVYVIELVSFRRSSCLSLELFFIVKTRPYHLRDATFRLPKVDRFHVCHHEFADRYYYFFVHSLAMIDLLLTAFCVVDGDELYRALYRNQQQQLSTRTLGGITAILPEAGAWKKATLISDLATSLPC